MASLAQNAYIFKTTLKGGPLGELTQWCDLICALHILGHDLTIGFMKEHLPRWGNVSSPQVFSTFAISQTIKKALLTNHTVSALGSGLSGPSSSPGQSHCFVFLGKAPTITLIRWLALGGQPVKKKYGYLRTNLIWLKVDAIHPKSTNSKVRALVKLAPLATPPFGQGKNWYSCWLWNESENSF